MDDLSCSAGPNVWDFQFFLTARSSRDAALAGGLWTVAYTLRWIIAVAFLILGISYFSQKPGFDAEKIMPMVINNIPIGVKGFFIAILLASISMLNAMINVTSSVVLNDFLKIYFLKNYSEKKLVRFGQLASGIVLLVALIASFSFDNIISAWETMIFVVVTMILIPATMRWHWWRFSARRPCLAGTTAFWPRRSITSATRRPTTHAGRPSGAIRWLGQQSGDSRFYGKGRIKRDNGFYNFQSLFFDMLVHAWRGRAIPNWRRFCRRASSGIRNWQRECFDPDDDGLYESYINTWPTDSVWYAGGAGAEETAYA